MDKLVTIMIGAICGIGQFFMLRYTLKPLTEGEAPKVGMMMLLKLPIPLILLLVCAIIDVNLLPFVGISFCLSLMAASIINHLITTKKKD